jgi:hypothetical protein
LEKIEMKTLRPRIIIEGTDYAGTKDIALALSKHPGIVGRSWERCYTAVISATWCSFTWFPWGEKLVDFTLEEAEQAIQNYRTWMSLIELQRHTGWIIDRFHLTTRKYQLLHYQTEYDFGWLEERLQKCGFHQVLVKQTPDSLREAINKPGNSSQLEQFDSMIEEQNLLRQLAATSFLPTTEIVVSENDVHKTTDKISDWIESVGANIPSGKDNDDRVKLPAIY